MAFLYPQLLVVITHPKLLVVYFKTPKKKKRRFKTIRLRACCDYNITGKLSFRMFITPSTASFPATALQAIT